MSDAEVPLVILHWKAQFYRSSSIAAMRNYFEERFRYIPCDPGIIRAWVDSAQCWKSRLPSRVYELMLEEYYRAPQEEKN